MPATKTAADAPKTLPAHAKTIWAKAYNSAWKGTCKDAGDRKEECVARVAWGAVKRSYKQTKGGKWVAKSDAAPMDLQLDTLTARSTAGIDLDMVITKASSSDGRMRWLARASDTIRDDRGTCMTQELFESFIKYSKVYGMPYLGVAHYGALEGFGVAGETESMWIDGVAFKAKGPFNENSLGRALFGAILKDRNDPNTPPTSRIRLSTGFLDLKHTHGDYVFIRRSLDEVCPICEAGAQPDYYLDGILVHHGATRVPVNRRTSIKLGGRMVHSSNETRLTRQMDAASIVGDDLADDLQRLTEEGFDDNELGTAEHALVVKAATESRQEAAQLKRSRRYGIEISKNSLTTIPAEQLALGASFADFGDPVGCRFPIWVTKSKGTLTSDQLQQVRDSGTQFNKTADEYSAESRQRVAARIDRALKKFELEERAQVTQPYAQEYAAFGGATTLGDALAWAEGQKTKDRVINTVWMMEAIASNILNASSDSVPDQTAALTSVLNEIGAYLGEMAKKPEANKMVQSSEATPDPTPIAASPVVVAPVAPPAEQAPTTPAPAPAVAPAPAPLAQFSEVVQPVVTAIGDFQAAIVPILDEKNLTKQDRLKQMQPALNAMSEALLEAADKGPTDPQNALAAAMGAAIGAELRPLVEGIQMVLAKMGADATPGGVRKSYSHVVPAAPEAADHKPGSIKDIVKKTTFRPGQDPRNTQ